MAVVKKPWPDREETYGTRGKAADEGVDVEDGWRYTESHEEDGEETEYDD